MSSKKILIVDGNNLASVEHHASPGNAADRFVSKLRNIRYDLSLDEVAVCWDGVGSWRKETYPTYKAAREPDEEREGAVMRCFQASVESELTNKRVNQYEADDLIATIADTASALGWKAMIYTTDHDLNQCLVPGKVNILRKSLFGMGREMTYEWETADLCFQKHGVKPQQWVDFRCLMGDKSDNLSGLTGFGRSRAAQLLQHYGSLPRFFVADDETHAASPLTENQIQKVMDWMEEYSKLRTIMTMARQAPINLEFLSQEVTS